MKIVSRFKKSARFHLLSFSVLLDKQREREKYMLDAFWSSSLGMSTLNRERTRTTE
jgi:hypothetical protein